MRLGKGRVRQRKSVIEGAAMRKIMRLRLKHSMIERDRYTGFITKKPLDSAQHLSVQRLYNVQNND